MLSLPRDALAAQTVRVKGGCTRCVGVRAERYLLRRDVRDTGRVPFGAPQQRRKAESPSLKVRGGTSDQARRFGT